MVLPSPALALYQEVKPPIVDFILWRAYRNALDDALIEMAQYLQENSPRGVSPINESLKGSWDVIPARKLRGIMTYEGSVVNLAERAINRLEGRGPGKFPPFGKGSNLEKWATSKGIPAFLVARKIAREGTERWKAHRGSPTTGLDPSSDLGIKAQLIFYRTFEDSLAARI